MFSGEFSWEFTGDIYGEGACPGEFSGVSVRIPMQDYRSLRLAGMTEPPWLIHRDKARPAELKTYMQVATKRVHVSFFPKHCAYLKHKLGLLTQKNYTNSI